MNKVIAATANDDFSLDLEFNDGSFKRFDARPYLNYEVFRELTDINYFRQVRLAFGTVQWPHEQDISPETLYLESVAIPVASRGNGDRGERRATEERGQAHLPDHEVNES
jgi:hypothetical protein